MCCSSTRSVVGRTRDECGNARSTISSSFGDGQRLPHHRFVRSFDSSVIRVDLNVSSFPGLKLQGATCRGNALFYSRSIIDDIPLLAVEWKLPADVTSSKTKKEGEDVTLPVYGNGLRTELLCTISVRAGQANSTEFHFYERGVAVLASSLD